MAQQRVVIVDGLATMRAYDLIHYKCYYPIAVELVKIKHGIFKEASPSRPTDLVEI